jgi:catechol 2,3-dioxygenase-like lactoylglutathione lyase family enzyme
MKPASNCSFLTLSAAESQLFIMNVLLKQQVKNTHVCSHKHQDKQHEPDNKLLHHISRSRPPQSKRNTIAFLGNPHAKGATLELTFYRNQKNFSQPNYEDRVFDHLAFEVEDMNQTIEAMRKEKFTITDEPLKLGSTGSLIAFVEDPDGTLIELIERKMS